MALGRLWAGRAFGTNVGNLYVEFSGDDNSLSGKLHFSEHVTGIIVFTVNGTFDGQHLQFSGTPLDTIGEQEAKRITISAYLNAKGELFGKWETTIGAAGTLHLFPHDHGQLPTINSEELAPQFHTARHTLGAIALDKAQLINIADEIQSHFKRPVVVTVGTGTEQATYLENFKNKNFKIERITFAKIHVQEPESDGLNKVASIEFGSYVNEIITQSQNQTTALGIIELIKQSIKPYQRSYITNLRKFGITANELLLIFSLTLIPSLATFFR